MLKKPHLTKKERALIEVLVNPENRLRKIAEVCELAGCDYVTYERAVRKDHFLEELTARSKEVVREHLGQVIGAFVIQAKRGSFQHGKVLLEMGDLYTPRLANEHSGPGGKPIPIQQGHDPELAALLAALEGNPEARQAVADALGGQGDTT